MSLISGGTSLTLGPCCPRAPRPRMPVPAVPPPHFWAPEDFLLKAGHIHTSTHVPMAQE